MQPHKLTTLPQSVLNSTGTFSKSIELNSSSISEKIVNYSRPPSYTFYQPSHSFSAVTPNTNKQYEKKEYHFVSESFSGNRISGIRPVSHQSLERQNNQNQQKGYGFKILNSVAKFETPQTKNKVQSRNYGSNPISNSAFTVDKDTTDFSKLEVKKISSYEQKKQSAILKMAESTIIQEQSKISEDKSKSKLNQFGDYSNLQQSIIIESNISLESLSHSELIKKVETLQIKEKQLEIQNYNFRQLLSNQSLNKRYQRKCQELNQSLQKCKKSQESLKISRNIISTLNQKIAKASRQAEANITNLQQKHQIQLADLKRTHQEECKKLQSTIFQLKLKVIDQTNAMEQALSKAQQQFKINLDKQYKNYQNQINDLRNTVQVNQNQIRRLNQIIINLESDLMKLDEQNMRMDQQIAKFITQSQISEETARNLRLQNETLAQQLSQTHLFLQDLKLQNIALKQKEQLMILVKQKNNNMHSTDEQKGFLMSNISNLQGQIKNLLEQIEQLKTQITLLKTEKDQLQQQLQQKEGQVAKLNIAKGSLMLQNLKFKEKFKKSTSQEFFRTQHDVQSQEMTNLKVQIARLKDQLQVKKSENQQKGLILSQKSKELDHLYQQIINREQELQILKGQFVIQKEQSQFSLKQTQEEWSIRCEDLKKELQLALQKGKHVQTIDWPKGKHVQTIDWPKGKNVQTIDWPKGKNVQTIDQAKHKQELNELMFRLREKDQKIQLLVQQLQKSSGHIEQQTIQIGNLRQQITLSKEQQELLDKMNVTISQLNEKLTEQSQNYEASKVQLTQTIDIQNITVKQLWHLIEANKQQNSTLSEQEKKLKIQFDNVRKQKISELEVELKKSMEIIEQQKTTIEQLNMELQMQEKDYRMMVEEQINKITMIYSEQITQLDSPFKTNLPKVVQEPQFPIIQNQVQQSIPSDSIQLQNMSRTDLINKIRELQFIKNSLQLKVQEINSMQQNLNDVIIDKLKNFEVNLQKNQQQKHELQQKVFQLTNQLQVMVQKCQQYQNKIEWVDNLYKEVQSNLSDTIQELIRAQALYYNLKLQVHNSNQVTLQQNVVQIQVQNLQDVKQDEVEQAIKQDEVEQAGKQDEVEQASNKVVGAAQNDLEKQMIQASQMIEEDALATQQVTDDDIEAQLKYYVKQTKNGDQVYQIIISQADSEQQEQHQIQKQENPRENQDDENDLIWMEEWKQQNELIYQKLMSSCVKDLFKKQEKQKAQQQPSPLHQQQNLHQQKNQMSNYIMNMIKNLQTKQNQKIAKQKRQRDEVFNALQQEQFLQIEQIYKQVLQIQQNVNHQ